ncbi:MAG TPA: hypothetical protein V6D29_17785 [Leptolyngbyaceae cyanobacterium]
MIALLLRRLMMLVGIKLHDCRTLQRFYRKGGLWKTKGGGLGEALTRSRSFNQFLGMSHQQHPLLAFFCGVTRNEIA